MQDTNKTPLPATFWWHNITQFGGAMNDNVFKLLMVYALIAWQGPEASASILAKVGVAFALPFLLIIPIAGSFADRFSKQKLIQILKVAEVGIMSIGVLSLYLKSVPMLYITMLLMSSQSAFFGPCKYGIIPHQVGAEKLSKANGSLQLFTFLAIISGTILAPELSLLLKENYALAACSCLIIAVLGCISALQIKPTPSHPEQAISLNGFATLFKTYKTIRRDGFLCLAVIALAVFSLAAAFIQLNILSYGYEHLSLQAEEATRLFLLTAVGIGIGSTLAGWLSGRSIEFGIVPIGALVISLSLFSLGMLAPGSIALAACSMLTLGIAAGLFIVPLESFIQYRSPEKTIGAIQAAHGFSKWLGILLASGLLYLNASVMGLSAQNGFLVLSFLLLGLALFSFWVLPDFFVKFVTMLTTRLCYKLQVEGLENIPSQGPALLVCNHVSLIDAVLIASSQQRRIRMLMSRSYYENAGWFTRKIVDIAKVIQIHTSDSPKKLIESLKTARSALDDGYLVCIFAEGALSRTGMMRPFKPGFERIVKGTDYPIIPVYIGGAWGSVSSYRHGMPKLRFFKEFRYPVSVHYGTHLPSSSTTFEVQQAVSELSVESYELKKNDRRSLSREFIQSARRNWQKTAIADSNGRELTYGELVTGGLLLKKRIQILTSTTEDTIGILLPPGSASALANLATTIDQRISVNLNYTAPAEAFEAAQKQCRIETVITSRAFLEHLPELPLVKNILYMEDLLSEIKTHEKVIHAVKARWLPLNAITASKKPHTADAIATILFSSGSSAEPKGILLSHHNILSNIESFRSVVRPRRDDVMLTALPFFHSFGYTVTMWFPLLSGITTCCHTHPLEAETIGKLAEKHKASILLTTPSFLLAYSRKVQPEQFANLRYVFTGAEKLQPRVSALFEKRFGIEPLEGYGATELSPVCALSLPNVEIDNLVEIGQREERLGRVLPGMAMRIIHMETKAILPPGSEGLICIKGPNVMRGYLNKPELTNSVLSDGWYTTGDIGQMDEDGFFTITGRLSRFSKIGGEMISHGAVEKALQEALGLGPETLAIVAITDDRKGEKLAIIHSEPSLESSKLIQVIKDLNIPNLWKPSAKESYYVKNLPLLGSGKLDYREMKKIPLAANT